MEDRHGRERVALLGGRLRPFKSRGGAWVKSLPRIQIRCKSDSSLGTREGMEGERRQLDVVGIDFGTTNSSVALVTGGSTVRLASFSFGGAETPSFRSVLYFEQTKTANGIQRTHSLAGPAAIERYLEADDKGRLIQSLKSHLPSRLLAGTEVFGRHYRVENLISRMLTDLRKNAEQQFGIPVRHAIVGRPVRFVGASRPEDDDFAVTRLREAFALAGFEEVDFELESVAAAYSYESTLDHDEQILIGDFGGGTSDFSLLRVGPGVRRRGRTPRGLIGNGGVGVAGDAFDARIVRKLVSPALGSNSEARSLNKILPAVPAWIYANLERWHYLSFLRTNNVRQILKSAHARALEPEKIAALIAIVEQDLGYQLHQAVQRVKFELSLSHAAEFRFQEGGLDLRIPVTRSEFEAWIAEELQAIERCVDSLLQSTGIGVREVDRVFLTGGTSFVPSVRRIFEARFGKDRVQGGNEFTSVARGLALRAMEPDRPSY